MNRSSVLLVLAVLLLCGHPASAYHLWLETAHTGDLMPGDTLTVEVHLDTESDVGLAYFSASVVFPDGILQYDRPASSQTSYVLYSPNEGKGLPSVYMVPRDATGPGAAQWPLASTGSCNAQEDHDLDGYGAPCDTDVNDDGVTALDEVLLYTVVAGTTNPAYDFNCDGAVGIDDYGSLVNDIVVYDLVGPSGLSCAGTAPCAGP